jgi:hypothetical protein
MESNSTNPKDHKLSSFNSWDELFEFQTKKDGANYQMLKGWLKEHFNRPDLKPNSSWAYEVKRNKKREANKRKVERREKLKIAKEAKFNEIKEMREEFGIEFLAFMDFKEITGEEIDFDNAILEANGFKMFVYGDGATLILVSKEEVGYPDASKYDDLLNEYHELSHNLHIEGKIMYKQGLSKTLGLLLN